MDGASSVSADPLLTAPPVEHIACVAARRRNEYNKQLRHSTDTFRLTVAAANEILLSCLSCRIRECVVVMGDDGLGCVKQAPLGWEC